VSSPKKVENHWCTYESDHDVADFAVFFSSRLDVHRSLPDTRHKACHSLVSYQIIRMIDTDWVELSPTFKFTGKTVKKSEFTGEIGKIS
jgi:hypothetical protein